jgi:hypothetical protein
VTAGLSSVFYKICMHRNVSKASKSPGRPGVVIGSSHTYIYFCFLSKETHAVTFHHLSGKATAGISYGLFDGLLVRFLVN